MTTKSPSPAHHSTQTINPFARALSEQPSASMVSDQMSNNGKMNEFGSFMDDQPGEFANDPFANYANSQMDQEEQARKMKEEQRRNLLRGELHRKVNPVETHDVFKAQEQKVKQEIDQIRYELKQLSKEVVAFEKDIYLTIEANVAQPGEQGKYYLAFFQKLREFITLLRKKIHSARTWAHTMTSKRQKGLNFKAKGAAQTKNVFDTMHHERSTHRAGG